MPKPRTGAPGTTDQLPTWEGPPENRPAGYLPAEDDPNLDRDAAGENLQDRDRSDTTDAVEARSDNRSREDRIRTRAHQLWLENGQSHGNDADHWLEAEREIDSEQVTTTDTQARAGAGPALAAHSKDAHQNASANNRETGARKLMPATGPDPRQAFSQDAAENRKPPLGLGLTEKSDEERSETDKSDLRSSTPETDAEGQRE